MAAQPWTAAQEYGEALDLMDDALQQKARLGIMSCAAASQQMGFVELKKALQLTDGNLSSHISFLEKRGYIEVQKAFDGKKPQTIVKATPVGVRALSEYIGALERLIKTHKNEVAKREEGQ